MDYNKKRNLIIIGIVVGLLIVALISFLLIKKFTSKEYKLSKLGYNTEEISTIINNDIYTFDEVMALEYNSNFVNLIREKYFLKKNYEKYLEYIDMKPTISELDEVTLKDIVAIVNVGANEKFYSNIKDTDTSKDTLMLINKFYKVSSEYVPNDITSIGLQYAFNGKSIRSVAYEPLKDMIRDAKSAGYTILSNSGYRTYEEQEKVYKVYKASRGEAGADLIAARPGHSEHETGLAVDISKLSGSGEAFDETPEFAWLSEHAHEYGFILRYPKGKKYLTGFDYESWHFRYVGIKVATEIKELGITFDEYYAYYLDK